MSHEDVGPLEAYSLVHQSVGIAGVLDAGMTCNIFESSQKEGVKMAGLLLDTALAAVRHAVAASPQKEFMVEAQKWL